MGFAMAALACASVVARADSLDADKGREQARAHFKAGAAQFEAEHYEEAIKEYLTAYEILPLPDILFNLGQAYRLKGDFTRSLEYYTRYLAIEPNGRVSDIAREHVAMLSRQLGRMRSRGDDGHDADDAREQARAHFKAGATHYEAGRYEEAIGEYLTAYKILPIPDILFNLGQAYRLRGDRAAALDCYNRYLAIAPDGTVSAFARERARELSSANEGEPEKENADDKSDAAEEAVAEEVAPKEAAHADSVQKSAPMPPVSPAPRPVRGRRAKQAAIGLGGAGAAAIVLAGIFTGLAQSANDRFLRPADGVYSPQALDQRGAYEALDITFFTLGGAALATGTALYLVGWRQSRASAR
jgi:tetratricopeptide (TPR) repeat protein